MHLPGFVGPSNVLSSTLADCERTINWFPESESPGTPKTARWLQDRPGLRWLFTASLYPAQGLYEINGRAFFVSGTAFCELLADDTYIVRGAVAFDGIDQATMASNGSAGNQVMVTAGSNGYIFNLSTDALTQITDPDFPTGAAVMCEFFAGYFFVLLRHSRTIQWSDLEDGLAWDALDVYERSWAADNINFIKRSGTHIWVVGEQTSEVLYATGGVEVFAPATESLIDHGSIARFSGMVLPQGIVCLDQDIRGVGQVVVFKGLQPDTVSTYAISVEQQFNTAGLFTAVSSAMQMNGHLWYLLNNASNENGSDWRLTPVLDLTEGEWHHWAHWDTTTCQWFPWVGNCHVQAFGRHYVGDRRIGAVYELSLQYKTDVLATL